MSRHEACELAKAGRWHSTPWPGSGLTKKLAPFNGFRWHPASASGRHLGGAWYRLRVEGLVELETEITDSLGIAFGCQFFGNYLPRSIGDVFAIGHVSPEGHTCARIANITLGTSPLAIVSRRAEPETLIETMAAVCAIAGPEPALGSSDFDAFVAGGSSCGRAL